jgi:hypothetical protein
MACRETKLTKEELINARKNGILIQQPKLNQTQEETLNNLDAWNNIVSKKDEKYFLFEDILLKTRVSEQAKRKSGFQEANINPDNEIKRQGGTFIHEIMRDLMDFHFNKKGDIQKIRDKALTGSVKLSFVHFNSLSKLAINLTKEINRQQELIDPKGKAEIRLETFVADYLKDIGGTIDVLAVFSDNTGAIYDYKSRSDEQAGGAIGYGAHGREVVRTFFPYYRLNQYDLAMGEYKRIVTERVGVKTIRQNRLIPIAVDYKYKKEGEGDIGNRLIPEVGILIAEQPGDFLKPIPVGGEQSRWEGINKLVEKQLTLQTKLSEKIKKGGLTAEEKKNLQTRVENINKSVMRTLVDEDIYDLIQTITNLTIEAETRLKEPKLKNGEDNPAYLSLDDLKNFKDELSIYDNIIQETHSYFNELKETEPEKYTKLKEKLYELHPYLAQAQTDISFEFTTRVEDMIGKEYRNEEGHLLPLEELSPGQLLALKISEIDNPIYQAVWKVIEEAQYDVKKKFEIMDEKVHSKLDNLFKWAKDNNMSKMDAFKIMINEKTGNLYAKLDSDFYKKLNEATNEKTTKGLQFIKDNYEFRDKEAFEKDYKIRLEGFKATEKARYNDFKPTVNLDGAVIKTAKSQKISYEKAIEVWINNNDLINSDQAWANESNRHRYLKLKDSILQSNYSPEYKKIKSIKPLDEFYTMWTEYMEEFQDILGISNYKQLPVNFIPNIRKEAIEHISSDGFHLAASFKEMIESFSVREEDIYLGTSDENGLVRKIPILFLNKFFTKDHKLDLNRKSYDLSKSLMIFGHMAYSYQYMNEIEPKINALKELLGNPTPEQGGIQSTDRLQNKIKGRIQPYMTKEGRTTKTYQLLEDITDCYLYGIRFKEKSLIKGVDTVHALTKLKNYNSVVKLSYAIIPAAGAFVAGKFGSYINAKKNIAYTIDQFAKATKLMVSDADKYKDITKLFDFPNDSYLERVLQHHMVSTKNKFFTSRYGFGPLRGADKNITNHIGVAMTQNYGVTPDGGIIRLNRKGIDPTKYKTILESLERDKDGKLIIKGLSKQGFIQFRAAVKASAGEIIGNMNADDIGAVDTDLLINQISAFKSWMPALIQEYTGKLRWDDTTQAMRWGRFMAYLSDFQPGVNYTSEELESGKYMYTYLSKVLAPNLSKLILDITTFGLAPRLGMSRINQIRAQREFLKWQVKNPGFKDKVTFDDFLEIKEGQMKAMLVQLRIIIGFMALAMFLGGKGDDGKPRYMNNFISRDLYKIFAKGGSELTFMWNPAEFIRIIRNPLPVTGLLTQLQHTVTNGFDETRDLFYKENRKGDPTPAGYYMMQWMPGAPQMMRFLEVYKNMERSPYEVYSQRTQ